jgi:hypothetical protein
MTTNIGPTDRIIRILGGGLLIGIALFAVNIPYSYLGWIGVIPIATAAFGSCPLYSVLGMNTCRDGLHRQ